MSDDAERKRKKSAKKPSRAGIVGPLFRWELVRLARRGQDARARFILALSLFFVLTFFTLIWFRNTDPAELFFGETQTLQLSESADFGAAFTLAFLIAQLAVLVLLTPAYAAAGIAEEKERKTFEFLLASELTAREIVFGKFLGRVVFLLGIMFAGLPILMICMMHGGASMKFLVLSYLVTGCTIIFLSAVSAACAASAATLRGALFRSYGLTAVIVLTGCGVYPLLSPFAIIPALFIMEPKSPETFWIVGLGYPALELAFAVLAVMMATWSVRKLRARLTAMVLAPPQRVYDRYDREDWEKERYLQKVQEWEEAIAQECERRRLHEAARVAPMIQTDVEPHFDEVEPSQEIPETDQAVLIGTTLPKTIPVAKLSERQPTIPPKPVLKIKLQPSTLRNKTNNPEYVSARSRMGLQDPFFWKEQHTSGTARTEDDDAMRVMMYLVGGVVILVVVMFLAIAVLSFISSSGGTTNYRAIKWLLLTAGGAGVFVNLLQIGIASTSSVCKERQRLTLESLLTIPVPRRDILWPKWYTSLTRGWWWGLPSAIVMALAFLASPAPAAIIPSVIYFAAAAPFATSLGVWLSIRCRTVNKALMWYLPVAGLILLVPISACNWISKDAWILAFIGMLLVAMLLVAGAWMFWKLAERAFERETVFGPGRG